jgi:hypothetical protein
VTLGKEKYRKKNEDEDGEKMEWYEAKGRLEDEETILIFHRHIVIFNETVFSEILAFSSMYVCSGIHKTAAQYNLH